MRRPNFRTIYDALAIGLGALALGRIFWGWGDTDPMWAIVAFVLVYSPDPREAYDSGLSRMFMTLVGCGIAVLAIFLFGLHKWLVPLALGLTAFGCGYFFQFRGAWRTLLICVVIVIGTTLAHPGGEVRFAITRAIEVASGSALAVLCAAALECLTKRREKRP